MIRALSQSESEKLNSKLKEIGKAIGDFSEPQFLEAYRKIIKKNLTFTQRKYLAAYLLLTMNHKESHFSSFHPHTLAQNQRKQEWIKKSNSQENNSQFRSLFFNVGKNRYSNPASLYQFLLNSLPLTNEDIGHIRILPKYSFVEIKSELCDTVIETLSNASFRGARLKVNYATNDNSEIVPPQINTTSVATSS